MGGRRAQGQAEGAGRRSTLAKAEQKTGVTLTVEARDGVIRGIVIGADKKPVADAWVTAHVEAAPKESFTYEIGEEMAGSGEKPPTLTGSDGAFTILETFATRTTGSSPRRRRARRAASSRRQARLARHARAGVARVADRQGDTERSTIAVVHADVLGCRQLEMPRQFTSKEGT